MRGRGRGDHAPGRGGAARARSERQAQRQQRNDGFLIVDAAYPESRSIPAEVRHRWRTNRLLIDDLVLAGIDTVLGR